MRQQTAMRDPVRTEKPRLLVIDDNPSIHRDFEMVLMEEARDADFEAAERRMYGPQGEPTSRKPAYQLDHALAGAEGVEKVNQALAEGRPYQLAFVDIRMPGIDGVETIRRIWQRDARIQIVICTAFADYSWEDLIRCLGHTDKLLVLKKPFDSIEVTLLVSTLVEKWFLAMQAALKLEQMELLVAQRTQRLMALQRQDPGGPPADAPGTASAAVSGSNHEQPVLLVVEAGAELRLAMIQEFGDECRILQAEDGEAGLRLAEESVPDLVLAEIILPGLEGLALCRRLKASELTSHIPVVVLGPAEPESAQLQALEAGADDYLVTPPRLPLLKARVDNLLRARRQGRLRADPPVQPRDLGANQADARFLRRAIQTVERHLSDYEFDVEAMARAMAVSRRQLFRKLKAVTGDTPNALLRAMRLNRAVRLLQESQLTVTEVTYAVGFCDLKHFRAVFREQFGVLPGDYTRQPGSPGETVPGQLPGPG